MLRGRKPLGASHPELGDTPQANTVDWGLERARSDLSAAFLASAPSSSLSKPPPFAKSSKSLLPIPAPHFLWPGSLRIRFRSGLEDFQAANPCVQTLLAKTTGITAGGLWSYWCAGRKLSMKSGAYSPAIITGGVPGGPRF